MRDNAWMRLLLSWTAAVLASACASPSPGPKPLAPASTAPATPPPPASTAPPAPPTACFPRSFAAAPLAGLWRAGPELTLCLAAEGGARACLSYAPQTGGFTQATEPPPVPTTPPKPRPFGVTGDTLYVCGSDTKGPCKTVKPGFRPDRGDVKEYVGDVDEAGSKLFLLHYVPHKPKPGADHPHDVFGEIFDLATGKRTASIPLPVGTASTVDMFSDVSDTWVARWAGPYVHLATHRCCGPDGQEALLDPKTGTLTRIGYPAFVIRMEEHLFVVGNDEGAERGGKGHAHVEVLDLRAGTRVAFDVPGSVRPAPVDRMLQAERLEDGRLAIAFAAPPGIAVFDPRSRTLRDAREAPLCRDEPRRVP